MAYTSLFKRDDVRITTAFSSTHKGLDLSRGIVEQPIYLPNKAVSGYVWKILPAYSTGGVYYPDSPIIYVKHKDGSGSRYIHSYPRNVKVKVGDTVVAGQQVCCTGNSGHSHGDHLHFEWLTKWDDLNTRVDPAPYVMNDKPPVDPCAEVVKGLEEQVRGLNESLGALQGSLNSEVAKIKILEERVLFLEATLKDREGALQALQEDYDRVVEEKGRFEQEKLALQQELDELKQGRDTWIQRIADVLHKLFGMK